MSLKSKSTRTKPSRAARELVTKDDIRPDGVLIRIFWDKFEIGSSAFIPCLNTTKAVVQIRSVLKSKNMKFDHTARIENGYYGLRIWRTE